MSGRKPRRRFGVVEVYEEGDGFEPLVHMVETFSSADAAKRLAESRAIDAFERIRKDNAETGIRWPSRMDEVWERVDNGERSWDLRDYGWSPIDGVFSFSIRVVSWEE